MATSPEEAKKLEEAQKTANQAIKEGSDLTKAFGRLLQSNLKTAKNLTVEMQSASNIIQRQLKDKKDGVGLEERLKNTKGDVRNVEKEINRLNDIGHTAIADKLKIQLKGLKTEETNLKRMAQLDLVTGGLITKAKALVSSLTLGAVIKKAIDAAKEFGKTIDSIGQQFGSLNVLGGDVTNNLLSSQIEAVRLGGSVQDVASITNTLASNFGMSLEEASKLSNKVFDTSKALGISVDESATLFGAFTQVANLSAEQAESLAEGTFQLARQNGVAPSVVLRDIAGSAETIALFTKDGGDNIGEAAIQARQLGLNLDTSAKIAEGLLDFESSITKEVEASVLIGRQLNLQKAREAALNNDIAGAIQEVVKQVGSEEEFNKLNLIQRKALADSIGVSVGEMAKLVGETGKLDGSIGDGFRDLLGEEALSSVSKLTNNFVALGKTLTNALGPALMLIAGTLNLVLSPIVALTKGLSEIGALGPIVTAALTGISAKLALNAAQASIATGQNIGLFAGKFATTVGALGPLAVPLVAAAVGGLMAVIAKAKNVNDFTSSPGGITTMMGPAGVFSLNPRDSVLATTNPIPVNDMRTGPAGSMNAGGGDMRVTVRSEGIQNRTIQQLVDVEFANGTPGNIV